MTEIGHLEYELRKLKERVDAIEKKLKEVEDLADSADRKATDVEDGLEDLTAVVASLSPEDDDEEEYKNQIFFTPIFPEKSN